ncbi:chorismate-binding protein [Candidatus Woesearchaeota archaeon]|nr:chorismate-binding protein [Candidatus Woesearchaeota archaeon]
MKIKKTFDPVAVFNNLNLKEGFILESADVIKKYGEKSIICPRPDLKITIRGNKYKIMNFSKLRLDIALEGTIPDDDKTLDEETRLKGGSAFDILRKVSRHGTLFGMIGYDVIDYFEDIGKKAEPIMYFYLCKNPIIIDHIKKETECPRKYLHALNGSFKAPKIKNKKFTILEKDFIKKVKQIKQHIVKGDIFQCVLSRTFKVKTKENPLAIYSRLKAINPGPYMFYFKAKDFALLGSSPETCLKVTDGIVEIKPIAGTFPRSKDPDLDSRYELNLLQDEKELAEHCMLLDLARNDIARVSVKGSRNCPEILKVEKFSHVQHLVSKVQGKLKPGIDALHAYRATMNMGTLTGAPKIKAMQLIRKYETTPREFYGGAVCYLKPNGDFDSCIVIRAITIKKNNAYIRAGAGIVYDSDPEKEALETTRKASACLEALGCRT